MSELEKKVRTAIKVLRLAENAAEEKALERERERENQSTSYVELNDYNGVVQIPHGTMEVCYSSGKDSDVILHLARMAGVKHTTIRKDTTIDPPGSNKHARDNGAYIVKPKETFFHLVERIGLPSRYMRHCCSHLKEYKLLDVQVLGIRREESKKRMERYKEPTICRNFGKNEHVEQFLPILDWTSEDVEEFIKAEHIQLHPLYYDKNGALDVTRRLGCIGCPVASRKQRLYQLKQYPRFVKRYIQCLNQYRGRKADKLREKGMSETDIQASFWGTADAYEHVYLCLFCDGVLDFKEKTGGLFKLDCKKAMEDYFGIDLTI